MSNIEELVGEGRPFDARHTNILGELLGKVISLIASDDHVEE